METVQLTMEALCKKESLYVLKGTGVLTQSCFDCLTFSSAHIGFCVLTQGSLV